MPVSPSKRPTVISARGSQRRIKGDASSSMAAAARPRAFPFAWFNVRVSFRSDSPSTTVRHLHRNALAARREEHLDWGKVRHAHKITATTLSSPISPSEACPTAARSASRTCSSADRRYGHSSHRGQPNPEETASPSGRGSPPVLPRARPSRLASHHDDRPGPHRSSKSVSSPTRFGICL